MAVADDPAPPPYPSAEPPATLYHAVPADRIEATLKEGLGPTRRPHVHLSRRPDHARTALKEQEQPIVLEIDAAAMHTAGHRFYVSPKGTWLVNQVPPQFLRPSESGG